jgi:hypothetical protein
MPKRPKIDMLPSGMTEVVPANTKFMIDDETGKAICGATTRSGGVCRKPPMANGRCRYHGGMVLKGPAHPSYKHGRYSKYVPQHLGRMIDDMAGDPNRLDQTEQMAILDAMLVETLKDFAAGGGGRVWDELTKLKQDYDRAGYRKDAQTQVGIIREVWAIVEGAQAKWMASKEAREIIGDRRKVTESERKRMQEEKQMIPLDQVAMAMSQIGKSILANVTSDKERQAVYNDVIGIIGSFTTNQSRFYAGNAEGEDAEHYEA